MEQHSRIVSERAFGSSRKIQFIRLTNEAPPSPMDSLLSAIDQAHPPSNTPSTATASRHHQVDINKDNISSSAHQTMSIESLLASSGESSNTRYSYSHTSNFNHPRQSASASTNEVSIASLLTSDNNSNHKRRWNEEENRNKSKKLNKKLLVSPANNTSTTKDKSNNHGRHRTIITCLHASVAQKSYGSEKRFLCPPPIVHIKSPVTSSLTAEQRAESIQLAMSVVCETTSDKILEQRSVLDENQSASFKYLHVTGTAKAKQFNLKVDLLSNSSTTSSSSPPSPVSSTTASSDGSMPLQSSYLASFMSKPISIISKPSKKTAKTRNISTCILANSPISLFNRINSQTVRTKYMTSCDGALCAKNSTWTPFDIIVINQPKLPQQNKQMKQHITTTVSGQYTSRIQLAHPPLPPPPQQHQANTSSKSPIHITYGTEIVLRDSQTGVLSPSLIIRKVDKGRIAQCAYGPVSQMQKIALQLASTVETRPIYLSAAGSIGDTSSIHTADTSSSNNTWIDYLPSRVVQPESTSLEFGYEEVDDYLCWTIVGIAKFEYDYYEDPTNEKQITDVAEHKSVTAVTPPQSPSRATPSSTAPLPMLTHIQYKEDDHTLDVVGQHLLQANPAPRLLDLWLGTHGPLVTRTSQPPHPQQPHQTHWSVSLPPTQDLLVSNHDLLVTQEDGRRRTLELPLLLVRQDGAVYHTGKALACDVLYDSGRWTVVAASTSNPVNTI